ncbi:MAG: DUF4157 domain-containing protein [Cyanobacteria bacterium P01_D01_bin.44]
MKATASSSKSSWKSSLGSARSQPVKGSTPPQQQSTLPEMGQPAAQQVPLLNKPWGTVLGNQLGQGAVAPPNQPLQGIGTKSVIQRVGKGRSASLKTGMTRMAKKSTSQAGKTGLPQPLKRNLEAMSSLDMGDVSVTHNSTEPAQIGAHAFTQGNNIYLGPGQDKQLPHEAWHVVQQKQGRVKPTIQARGWSLNDNPALEKEADTLGAKAAHGLLKSADAYEVQAPRVTSHLPVSTNSVVQGKFYHFYSQKLFTQEEILTADVLAYLKHMRVYYGLNNKAENAIKFYLVNNPGGFENTLDEKTYVRPSELTLTAIDYIDFHIDRYVTNKAYQEDTIKFIKKPKRPIVIPPPPKPISSLNSKNLKPKPVKKPSPLSKTKPESESKSAEINVDNGQEISNRLGKFLYKIVPEDGDQAKMKLAVKIPLFSVGAAGSYLQFGIKGFASKGFSGEINAAPTADSPGRVEARADISVKLILKGDAGVLDLAGSAGVNGFFRAAATEGEGKSGHAAVATLINHGLYRYISKNRRLGALWATEKIKGNSSTYEALKQKRTSAEKWAAGVEQNILGGMAGQFDRGLGFSVGLKGSADIGVGKLEGGVSATWVKFKRWDKATLESDQNKPLNVPPSKFQKDSSEKYKQEAEDLAYKRANKMQGTQKKAFVFKLGFSAQEKITKQKIGVLVRYTSAGAKFIKNPGVWEASVMVDLPYNQNFGENISKILDGLFDNSGAIPQGVKKITSGIKQQNDNEKTLVPNQYQSYQKIKNSAKTQAKKEAKNNLINLATQLHANKIRLTVAYGQKVGDKKEFFRVNLDAVYSKKLRVGGVTIGVERSKRVKSNQNQHPKLYFKNKK